MREPDRFAALNSHISLGALHERMVVFAQDAHSKLVHVDAVPRGKACNCRCLACDEALVARHGDIKAHSFAHASGTECQFAVDAVLVQLAQALIAEAGMFVTPPLLVQSAGEGPLGPVRHEETIAAARLRVDSVAVDRRVHRQRPSLVMMVNGRELLLEVTYGHRLDSGKRRAIEQAAIAAIEMHVGAGQADTVGQFSRFLLEEVSCKYWIVNPKGNAIQDRLDVMLAAELAQQQAQHEQQERQRLALVREREAAREAEREAARAAQAQRERELRQAQREREQRQATERAERPVAARPAALSFRLRDGGVVLQHETGGAITLVPETGAEAVLQAFAQLGLPFCEERRAYLASKEQLGDLMLALRPHQLSVRSL